MASKLLKALSPAAALLDGPKSFLSNFSPAYALARGDKDKDDPSYLQKAIGMTQAGKMRGMKKGGKVKSGGKVKGAGCCKKGVRKCKMY